jgi:hypothetical protein
MEQIENKKLCFKPSKTPTETYEMLQYLCGDEALSSSIVSEWFKL